MAKHKFFTVRNERAVGHDSLEMAREFAMKRGDQSELWTIAQIVDGRLVRVSLQHEAS